MSHTHDPEHRFGDPRQLAADPAISDAEKLRILESWRLDLVELQRAEEENMPSAGVEPDETAKKLAEVSRVLDVVSGRVGDGDEAPKDPMPKPPPGRDRKHPDNPRPIPADNPKPASPKRPID